MDKKAKTWLLAVLGVLIVIAMLGVAAVGGVVYFVYSHVESAPASQTDAADRFAAARGLFGGRQPLIELREDQDEPIVRLPDGAASPAELQTLRVLVYDRHDEQLTDVRIPFWIVRLMPHGHFNFRDGGISIDSDDLRLTAADLERYGPGLILDHEDKRSGSHALVWVE